MTTDKDYSKSGRAGGTRGKSEEHRSLQDLSSRDQECMYQLSWDSIGLQHIVLDRLRGGTSLSSGPITTEPKHDTVEAKIQMIVFQKCK